MTDNQESLGKQILDSIDTPDGIDTNVDIVFAIDATRSMQPIIDMVKNSALTFHTELKGLLAEHKRIVNHLRIKVIWFRDFYYDGDKAYGESRFFELDDESQDFKDFVSGIQAAGGGDDPECGLEALSMAMRSDFTQEGTKRRHIIVLFTDAGAHKLEDYDSLVEEASKKGCVAPTIYPENMPKDLTELTTSWSSQTDFAPNLDCDGRRLVLFSPNAYPWTDIEMEWEKVIRKNINSESGGAEIEIADVYSLIVNSL